MRVVFTTLQGSLTHPSTGSVSLAQPALQSLMRRGIPIVYVSVCSAAEILALSLPLEHPFIAEDGGTIYVPTGYFPPHIIDWPQVDDFWHYQSLGLPYGHLRQVLNDVRLQLKTDLIGFGDWTDAELAAALSVDAANALAMRQRDTSEIFSYSGDADILIAAMQEHHVHVRQLQRQPFRGKWLLTGNSDRRQAVDYLLDCYTNYVGSITTLGIGSNAIDAAWLEQMDRGVMLPGLATWSGEVATLAGPEGWREIILDWLSNTDQDTGIG